jgi:hypothetical protein
MQIVRQKYSPPIGIKAPEADQFEVDYPIMPDLRVRREHLRDLLSPESAQ